jgi:hypothetical protein
VLGTERLWVSIDRYGIMRPTVLTDHVLTNTCNNNNTETTQPSHSDIEESQPKERNQYFKEEWKTKPNWLHWDLSPFHYGTSAAGYLLNKNVSNDTLRMMNWA